MFNIFKSKMSVNKARVRLNKLEQEKLELLKIINGEIISEDEINHGTLVVNRQGTIYRIKAEGFGLFNLYGTTGFIENKVLPSSVIKTDLVYQLNENNFRIYK